MMSSNKEIEGLRLLSFLPTKGELKDMKKETLTLFLAELSALTRKYGIEITGCGCCGSPYLISTDTEDLFCKTNLIYVRRDNLYHVSDEED